jgi:hypothetical protein
MLADFDPYLKEDQMTTRRAIALTLLILVSVFLVTGSVKPVSAWPWDKYITVKIEGQSNYWFMPGSVDCKAATLIYYPGKVIHGSISNSWFPAKCTATFNSVPVNTWVSITLKGCDRASCILSSPTFTKHATRHTGSPPLTGSTKTLEKIMIN